MADTPQTNDPYAPPPRYKNKSGAMVRVALLAAMLAGAAWGYMTLQNMPQTVLVAPAGEEQSFADAGSQGYAPLATEAPAPAAPAATPAPSQTPSATPGAPAADAVPPPSTTTAPSSAPAPLPAETPAGD
jgi:hypothetical protein